MTVTDLLLADGRTIEVTGVGYYGHGELLMNGVAVSEGTDVNLTNLVKVSRLWGGFASTRRRLLTYYPGVVSAVDSFLNYPPSHFRLHIKAVAVMYMYLR